MATKMAGDILGPYDTAHLLVKKHFFRMLKSSVVPGYSPRSPGVLPRSTASHAANTCAGSVESTMCNAEKTRLRAESLDQNTSGQKARTAHAQQQSRFEALAAHVAAQLGQRREDRSAGARQYRSSPSTFSSPSRVHRLGSFFQKRSILRLACQSAVSSHIHGQLRRSAGITRIESSYSDYRFCIIRQVA